MGVFLSGLFFFLIGLSLLFYNERLVAGLMNLRNRVRPALRNQRSCSTASGALWQV